MGKIRASILVIGSLLSKFKQVHASLPGGDLIGSRPIDLHLKAFEKMGASIEQKNNKILASANKLKEAKIIFDYPSVGATENVLMLAATIVGKKTTILNAALEPEVLDLIEVLKKMGAAITVYSPATIEIIGASKLSSITHTVIPDRLEAGTYLLAASINRGYIKVHNAPVKYMDVFLQKLIDMGHYINIDFDKNIIDFKATKDYSAISFKTMPYPGFPTDLQAPTMAVLSLAKGKSVIHETVFENRLHHANELIKMGAKIDKTENTAYVNGVSRLKGNDVIANDIRAGAALIIAGLQATDKTVISGVHHVERGYDNLIPKLQSLGATIYYKS
jgi:UDP-N-acetylglucosamine 1-carboxyvinyltransferase